MSRILPLVALLCFLFSPAHAQWELGFGGVGLGPVDRFEGSVYKPGAGLFFNLTTQSFLPEGQPWELRTGIYIDRLKAGKKAFDVMLSDPINEEGETRFENFNIGHHMIVRLGYKASPTITLFTDGIVGHRHFFSETTTGIKGYSEEYEDDVKRVHSYRTFRYGVGFGTRIAAGRSFGIEVRADYTRGNNATYFDMNSIEETSTSFEYEDQSWDHTDLFVYGVALNWKLFRPQVNNDVPPSSTNSPTYYSPTPSYSSPRRTSPTPRGSKPKKTVTPGKDIKKKEEKKEEKINW